ncbi:hypothetical protein ACWF62_17810 [Rhodococcus sp. NPDC054953]
MPTLIPEDLATHLTGRPGSTIRRWAAEGRISRHGSGRGQVRYDADELPPKVVDEWTGAVTPAAAPPVPQRARTG